ncbi:MAG TPA: hypothetical protein VMR54_13665 [Thermoanaerobaculia bacterium]|nr:hypothetical protein [Thermoanaerobaculia bacterium]
MAEHLHGYPRCETPAGTSCTSSDLHFEECKNHGALRSCEASVVDGIPTGQYRCVHDDAPAKPARKPAAKAKPRPKKKPAAKPKRRAKKAARKPAKKARSAPRKKVKKAGARRGGAKKGARKKK